MAKRVLGKDPFSSDSSSRASSASDKKSGRAARRAKPAAQETAAANSEPQTTSTPAPVASEPAVTEAPAPIASEPAVTRETANAVSEVETVETESVIETPAPVIEQTPTTTANVIAPVATSHVPRASQSQGHPRDAHTHTDETVFDVARELLSSDYYRQQWGRTALRSRSEEIDEFGMDPKYVARWRTLFDFLYERWWRIETTDIEHVPAQGRVILCANHSGAIPYDGAMLATALRREHPARRELRWLAEDFVFHFPFLGTFMNRIGAVRACQENAERLLRYDACVGVFPEGIKGISKLYNSRYRLQRFGRGGHVKLAIRTQTPIVPVAIMGAEETHPLLATSGWLARLMGLPYLPITPTFPWLGPLGMVPLPSKWRITFLEPIRMEGFSPDDADDDVLVGRLNEKIRVTIQEELDRLVRNRRSVIYG